MRVLNKINGSINGSNDEANEQAAILSFDFAAAVASLGLVAIAALVWINSASAAVPPRAAATALGCEDRLASLYLGGSFVMPGTADSMQLWVGKSHQGGESGVVGMIAKGRAAGCEAQCKVIRFERFKKDMKPALMELDCEGATIKTLRMPLHIQWVRGDKGKFETIVRLGSSIYGVEEAPLRLEVNRYSVAAKQ